MKCPKCHTENSDASRFCSNCAAPLGTEADQVTAPIAATPEPPVSVLEPGALVAGKYKIVEEVGRGGMGIVYKAEDLRLKRFVALKFLPPELTDTPEVKARFLVEAQAAAALSHSNICTIYEVGESEGRSYIAMEYVEGRRCGTGSARVRSSRGRSWISSARSRPAWRRRTARASSTGTSRARTSWSRPRGGPR